MKTRAVFLDRDGVLIEDVDLLTTPGEVRILPGVPQALQMLAEAGFALLVVSNQPVVARGMATEAQVEAVNQHMAGLIRAAGGPSLGLFYICPHHPNATLPQYRLDCACRKPRPGLLLQAARDHSIDMDSSFMIGDRMTDIIAGVKAGARAILVETGRHTAPAIQTAEPIDTTIQPAHRCPDLFSAAKWIISANV